MTPQSTPHHAKRAWCCCLCRSLPELEAPARTLLLMCRLGAWSRATLQQLSPSNGSVHTTKAGRYRFIMHLRVARKVIIEQEGIVCVRDACGENIHHRSKCNKHNERWFFSFIRSAIKCCLRTAESSPAIFLPTRTQRASSYWQLLAGSSFTVQNAHTLFTVVIAVNCCGRLAFLQLVYCSGIFLLRLCLCFNKYWGHLDK